MMTEKEKMLSHQLYDANNDKNLLLERTYAKELCYDYNHLGVRVGILGNLFPR